MNTANPSRPARAGHRRLRRRARAPVRGRVVSVPRNLPRHHPAFTLAEILIALCLILLVGSLAVANLVNIANGIDQQPPEKVLQAAIRQARYVAMQRMTAIGLTYNSETATFDILDDKGGLIEQIPTGLDPKTAKLTLEFTPVLPMKDLTTDYKTTLDDPEFAKQKSPRLLFHPSGVTSPVQVLITNDLHETKFMLDPFSEGPPPKRPLPMAIPPPRLK